MNFYLSGQRGVACSIVLLAVLVSGCGGSAADGTVAGPGITDLAPSYDAQPTAEAQTGQARAGVAKAGKVKQRPPGTRTDRPSSERTGSGSSRVQTARTGAQTRNRSPRPPQSGPAFLDPAPVRISDPAGDLTRSLEGAPGSADIVAVQLDRTGDTVEVRHTFAGPVPARMESDKGMNVASFYDVDGNGIVDYEVWASLADNGWGTGHLDRRERESSFGPSTGIEVSVQGDTLVTRFPLARIGGVERFRWSTASEWGSFESMAASTSARDHAPGEGAVAYPG